MQTAVTPLSFDDLSGWLKQLITAAEVENFPPFFQGPYIQELPNRICTLTLQPGSGYVMEGAGDQPHFQVRIRSDQLAQNVAERDAFTLDKLIFQARFPTKLSSGMNLLLVARLGGAPATLGPPDSAQRFDYICNYTAVVGVAST